MKSFELIKDPLSEKYLRPIFGSRDTSSIHRSPSAKTAFHSNNRSLEIKKKKEKRIARESGPVERGWRRRHWRTRVPADSEAHLRNAPESATTCRVSHAPVSVRSGSTQETKMSLGQETSILTQKRCNFVSPDRIEMASILLRQTRFVR